MRAKQDLGNTKKNSTTIWAVFRFYLPNFSGTAIQSQQIYTLLAAQGFNINILAAADHKAADLAGQVIEDQALTVHYLPVVRSRSWDFLSNFRFIWKLFLYLNSLLKSLSLNLQALRIIRKHAESGDILHLHSLSDFSYFLIRAAGKQGLHTVLVMTLLGTDDPRSMKGPAKYWKVKSFKRAQSIISISTAMTESCLAAGIQRERIRQIPRGVDVERFKPLDKKSIGNLKNQLGLDTDKRYLIFAGSALHRKGIDVVIDTYAMIAVDHPDLDLLIVGPYDFSDHSRHYPERQELVNQLITKLDLSNLSNRVHWIGRVDNINEYMAIADVFCFPTRREGFGIVIVEALASGLPCVVAHIEGVTTDLIPSDRIGYLIQGYKPDIYADAIQKILTDPILMNSLRYEARRYAEEKFDLDKITLQYNSLYRELASKTNV